MWRRFKDWSLSKKLWIPSTALLLALGLGTLFLSYSALENLRTIYFPEQRVQMGLSILAFDLLSETREYIYHPTDETFEELAEIEDELQETLQELGALLGPQFPAVFQDIEGASQDLIQTSRTCTTIRSQVATVTEKLTEEINTLSLETADDDRLVLQLLHQSLWLHSSPDYSQGRFEQMQKEVSESRFPRIMEFQERLISLHLEMDEAIESLEETEQNLSRELEEGLALTLKRLEEEHVRTLSIIGVLCILTAFLGPLMARWLAGSITRPINTLQEFTQRFAEGQFEARATIETDDEVGQLARSFNRQAESVEHLILVLRAEREFSDKLLAAIPSGLIAIDNEGHIINTNAVADAMLLDQFDISAPTDQSLPDLLQSPRLQRALQRVLAGAEVQEVEIERSRIWNFTINAVATNASRTNSGERTGDTLPHSGTIDLAQLPAALVVLQDVTERQRMTQQLQENLLELRTTQEQLVQSGKMVAIGELASGVAHELNNPLTAVITYAVLLNEKLEQTSPDVRHHLPKFQQRLKLIQTAANQCQTIVKDLLAFARQDSSEFQPVDVAQVLQRASDLTTAQVRKKRIVEHLELPDSPILVSGNANQLQQVLINLILNAVQAMEPGGNVTLSAHADSDRCTVEVTDTGTGIPNENLPRIFEPFFTTKPSGQGTGLGLSIVYGIITNHGGDIQVESEVGRGSRFQITLPLAGKAPMEGNAVRET